MFHMFHIFYNFAVSLTANHAAFQGLSIRIQNSTRREINAKVFKIKEASNSLDSVLSLCRIFL